VTVRLITLLGLLLIGATPVSAQDSRVGFPFGTVVVVLPAQATEPLPGGTWPGHAATAEEALRGLDAELEFALSDRRGAENWAMPSELRRRVKRNPILDVNPDRLAYQGLLKRPDPRDQLYEPLHGELRTLAALFGTRYLMLPLLLQVEQVSPDELADGLACPDDETGRRAVLLVAFIDIRRSAVIWHGTVRGAAVCPESGALLASLATVIAREIVN
jgi:hypothetical protein